MSEKKVALLIFRPIHCVYWRVPIKVSTESEGLNSFKTGLKVKNVKVRCNCSSLHDKVTDQSRIKCEIQSRQNS